MPHGTSAMCSQNNSARAIVLVPSYRWSMPDQDHLLRIPCATCTTIQWKISCVIWRVQANTRLTIVWHHGIRTIKFQGLANHHFSRFFYAIYFIIVSTIDVSFVLRNDLTSPIPFPHYEFDFFFPFQTQGTCTDGSWVGGCLNHFVHSFDIEISMTWNDCSPEFCCALLICVRIGAWRLCFSPYFALPPYRLRTRITISIWVSPSHFTWRSCVWQLVEHTARCTRHIHFQLIYLDGIEFIYISNR